MPVRARESQGRTPREVSGFGAGEPGYRVEIERRKDSFQRAACARFVRPQPCRWCLTDAGRADASRAPARATLAGRAPAFTIDASTKVVWLRRWCRWRWPAGRRSVRVDKMRHGWGNAAHLINERQCRDHLAQYKKRRWS